MQGPRDAAAAAVAGCPPGPGAARRPGGRPCAAALRATRRRRPRRADAPPAHPSELCSLEELTRLGHANVNMELSVHCGHARMSWVLPDQGPSVAAGQRATVLAHRHQPAAVQPAAGAHSHRVSHAAGTSLQDEFAAWKRLCQSLSSDDPQGATSPHIRILHAGIQLLIVQVLPAGADAGGLCWRNLPAGAARAAQRAATQWYIC